VAHRFAVRYGRSIPVCNAAGKVLHYIYPSGDKAKS
jgi:hypothetical protein